MSKHVLFSAAIMLMSVVLSRAQTNFVEQISTMWLTGQKAEVLNIANQRLAVNSNDMAGLILKMEYEITFVDIPNFTNSVQRVIDVGGNISTTNFVPAYIEMKEDILDLLQLIPDYSVDEIAADQPKGNIAGKSLLYGDVLQALQDDGYFQ